MRNRPKAGIRVPRRRSIREENRNHFRHGDDLPAGVGRQDQLHGRARTFRPNSATVGEVRMAEPSPYHVIVDRISHDIPFYRGYLKNAALSGTDRHQQSFLVERRRQVLQLRAGRPSWASRFRKTVLLPHKEHPPGTTDRSMRNLQYPHAVGQHLQLRRISRVPQALRRRRLEGRVQGQLAGGVLPRLRPEPRSLHDAAARREVQGILPLLRASARRRCTSCTTILRRPSTSAT